MAKASLMNLRQRVIHGCDAGMKTKAVALKHSACPSWARWLKQQRRERGDIALRRGGGSRGRKFDRQHPASWWPSSPTRRWRNWASGWA